MEHDRVAAVLAAGGLADDAAVDAGRVVVDGDDPVLPTALPIGEVAAVTIGLGARAAADIHRERTGVDQDVEVSVRSAAVSLLSFAYQRLDDQPTPRTNADNATVALYRCADRWIHLHGGFPGLAAGTLRVLGLRAGAGRPDIERAVSGWKAQDLEDALAADGLCGAMVRTRAEWDEHPQGHALAGLAGLEVERIADADGPSWPEGPGGDSAARPLAGIRVLDATRVLAGPTCGRTLAEHGADVLRVASPRLPSIAPFVMDTGHGKRSAFADLDDPDGRAAFEELLDGADVFSCGYRAGSFERRGLGPADVAARRPGIVYVSINAYGHVGPWRERPGWEQLAQSASGVAVVQGSEEQPQLLPAAATDYTTGYLAAYGAMVALRRRAVEGGSWHVRVSLTQTAMWLLRLGPTLDPADAPGIGDAADLLETTVGPFGTLTHLRPVATMSVTPPRWELPAVPLGAHPPVWP